MIRTEISRVAQPTLNNGHAACELSSRELERMTAKAVLLVDDDRNTALFVRFALKHINCAPALHYVADAMEAMRYVKGEGRFANRDLHPFPDLILLDLRMPLLDGFELLQWLRSQPAFRLIPVVILTGSLYKPDADRALQMGASGFLVKSGELQDFEQCLKRTVVHFLQPADANPVPA